MCGIAGVIGPNAKEHAKAVEAMLHAMAHRGPDDEGVFVAPSGACVLGHRRLSILDPSAAAAQPMTSVDGHLALAYNGECYNYQRLREEIFPAAAFRSSGDTELVLRLLGRFGVEALEKMNAMFALALWDEHRQTLLLARDRFGQKPLYYAQVGNLLLFASEVRGLLASGLVPRRAAPEAIRSFLAYGAVQGPATIVEGVSLLGPGAFIEACPGGEIRHADFCTSDNAQRLESVEDLKLQFSAAVERHLISDVPIGVFLSGGVDSSAIAAVAGRVSERPINTLCVVYPDHPQVCEASYAALVARSVGSNHTEISVTGGEIGSLVSEALDAMDQPTCDGINTYIVSRAAREAGLTVVLSGLGGDELFGGYSTFDGLQAIRSLRRWLGPLRGPIARLLENANTTSSRSAKIAQSLSGPQSLFDAYLLRRRLFTSSQIAGIAPSLFDGNSTTGLDKAEYQKLNALGLGLDTPDSIAAFELRHYMGQTLLRDSDVMGMANSIEIRMPFLDGAFASSALAGGPEVRARGRRPKQFLTDGLNGWLPSQTVERPKQGFTLPLDDWMRGELKAEVEAGLDWLGATQPLFAPAALRSLWEAFLKRPDSVGWVRPWALFALSRYLRKTELQIGGAYDEAEAA